MATGKDLNGTCCDGLYQLNITSPGGRFMRDCGDRANFYDYDEVRKECPRTCRGELYEAK